MPNYPTDPNIIRDILDLKRRVKILEAQMATRTGPPGPGVGPVYDSNVLWNGRVESGSVGWAIGFWSGPGGALNVDTVNPLDGLRSLRMDEPAGSGTEIWWRPTGGALAGSDVFATVPGDQWLIEATVRSTVAITHAQIIGICGTAEADCYGLFGAQTFVVAADVALTANAATSLSGLVTVPATRNFITFMALAGKNDTPIPTTAYSWWLDDVSMRRKL